MVVHVVRGDGLSGVSAPQMGKVRELAVSLGATVHTVVGDDVPTALLDFAREMNATQLVLGTSRRSKWARIFDEGIGASVVQHSGKIDVHMVTHPEAAGVVVRVKAAAAAPHSWLAASGAAGHLCPDCSAARPLPRAYGESALFFIGVLVVALLGGVAPRGAVRGALRAAVELLPVDPRYTFTIAEADSAVTIVVLLLVAVAVAALVDGAAKRAREAKHASQEAEPRRACARRVDPARRGPEHAAGAGPGETYSQRAVSLLREGVGIVARVGTDPCVEVDAADTAVEVGDDEFLLLLAGKKLAAKDRRVLGSRRQAGGEPGRAA